MEESRTKTTKRLVHIATAMLNLSIAGTVKVGPIESVLEKMAAINIFFNYSPKREK